jgi:ABC-type bacteriocin/lantibiotic exporter with double-glycine peptidase domain
MELAGDLFGFLVQLVNGISKLRVTGAERRAFAHWAKGYTRMQRLSLRSKAFHDGIVVLNAALSLGSLAAIFAIAAETVGEGLGGSSSGAISTGVFLAFTAAFGSFLSGATALSETLTTVLEVVNLTRRARPILEAKPETDRGKVDPDPFKGKIALDRVSFRYRPDGPLTLDAVSLHAEPGELIALVGESGSGKSTLVKLLLGFETPASGMIAFDDHDLRGLDIGSVRRQLGVVIQGGKIASGSIHENIAEGRVVSIAEATEAIRAAGMEADVEAMAMGLQTVVSEGGTNLSGGQRQRLLIARAIVTKPRILIFDEATSALDNRTQAIVNESLEALKVTRIVIAHRLSTIRNAKRIYVLEKGRVAEVGTFDELAKAGGLFARFVERQRA